MLAKFFNKIKHIKWFQYFKIFNFFNKKPRKILKPCIIARSNHNVSRSQISKPALKVLYRLREAGFDAYLVGGGVRDVLLNRHPKDFDIATNARPEQIKMIFNNCRLIGRRFRLAHIHFSGHIIEVATFRADGSKRYFKNIRKTHSELGMLMRDNIYGTLEQDVLRRDFTINAIYYNIADFSLIDFVGGLEDIENKILRVIGEPTFRYREDPVRMLRIIRFAAKLGFNIDKESEAPIFELKSLLNNIPSARLFDEYLKLFLTGFALTSFSLLRQYQILEILFPQTEASLKNDRRQYNERFITLALQNTEERFAEEKPIAPAFLLAVLLWPSVENVFEDKMAMDYYESQAFFEACSVVLSIQQKSIAIPKRLAQIIREIWLLQFKLEKRSGKRAYQLFIHPRFKAAYDFCLLRSEAGDKKALALIDWWTLYLEADNEARIQMAMALQKEEDQGRRRKKKKK